VQESGNNLLLVASPQIEEFGARASLERALSRLFDHFLALTVAEDVCASSSTALALFLCEL